MAASRSESCPDSPDSPDRVAPIEVQAPGATARICTSLQSTWNRQFAGKLRPRLHQGGWLPFAVLACVSGVLLFPDNRPLLDPDEGRHAEIARVMLASGDLIVPRLQDIPYYEKPPLQYWLTLTAYRVLGVDPWVARIIPAVAAWLTLLITFKWARRYLGICVAFLGGMCLCLSLEFVILGRTVLLDALLTLCLTTAFFAAHVSISGPRFRWHWWLFASIACGSGILTKGPIVLVLFLPSFCLYLWFTKTRVSWIAAACFLIAAIGVAAPWFLMMAWREPGYFAHFFWKGHVLRFVQPFDHQQPWWFYLPVLLVGTFPWSLLWPGVAVLLVSKYRGFAMRRTPALGYCVLLFLWPLIFFSLSGCKSPPYLLPALVPLALLTGACLETVIFLPAVRRIRIFANAQRSLPCHAAIAVLLLGATTYIVAAKYGWATWDEAIAPAVLGLSLSTACGFAKHYVRPVVAWGLCAAACVGFCLFPCRDVHAAFVRHHSPLTIIKLIEEMPDGSTCHVITADRVWYSASFYLRRTIPAHHGEIFYERLQSLWDTHPETLVLVRNNQRLQFLLERIRGQTSVPEHTVTIPEPKSHVALVTIRRTSRDVDSTIVTDATALR